MASDRQPKESGSYEGLRFDFLLVKMAANLDDFSGASGLWFCSGNAAFGSSYCSKVKHLPL